MTKRLRTSVDTPKHLLLALAADERSATGRLLADFGLGRAGLLKALTRETERSLAAVGVSLDAFALPQEPTARRRGPKFGASAKRALERALQVAATHGDRRIQPPHLLLGVLRAGGGTVPRALTMVDVDRAALVERAEKLLGSDRVMRVMR